MPGYRVIHGFAVDRRHGDDVFRTWRSGLPPQLAERAKLLISIAAPQYREELERAAAERFGYSFLRLR